MNLSIPQYLPLRRNTLLRIGLNGPIPRYKRTKISRPCEDFILPNHRLLPSVPCTPLMLHRLETVGYRKSNENGEKKYSDRFIPSRVSSNLTFSVWDDASNNRKYARNEEGTTSSNNSAANEIPGDADGASRQDGTTSNGQQHSQQQQPLLNALLRSELLGENLEPNFPPSNSMTASNNDGTTRTTQGVRTPLREGGNFLRFNQSRRQSYHDEVFRQNSSSNPTSVVDSFNLSPVGIKSSHRLMNLPQKRKRKIAKVPFKVLDAPSLADDFYLNLVDWSSLNVLAVGLGSCVYLWSACTSKVTKLCDLGVSSQDSVTSVVWTQKGTHLAVGVNNGEVQIWDTIKCKKIRTM
jgi:cell division cycle 20-like protein 1 (cofactor of APC complex)